ncbi:unnamed protein product [Closterium sp. NIES-54]
MATVKEAAEEEGGNEEEEEEEEGGVEGFREEEEAEAEASEEDAPPTTSPLTPPPPLNSPRFVSPSSLLSLYCFFSSHLGISSPSTIASLLATYPQLLRSNPTNDFLPRVRLLQSYGISHADLVHITASAVVNWAQCSDVDGAYSAGILVAGPDGTGGGVAATAATATAATATDFASLPLVDLQQLFLWVAVSQAVAEELLFRGLLLTALQGRLGSLFCSSSFPSNPPPPPPPPPPHPLLASLHQLLAKDYVAPGLCSIQALLANPSSCRPSCSLSALPASPPAISC